MIGVMSAFETGMLIFMSQILCFPAKESVDYHFICRNSRSIVFIREGRHLTAGFLRRAILGCCSKALQQLVRKTSML